MNRKVIQFLLTLLFVPSLKGQVNSSFDSLIARYEQLDSSYIHTNILWDRFPLSGLGDTVYLYDPGNFEGVPSSDLTGSLTLCGNLLSNLRDASYHPKPIPPLDSVALRLGAAMQQVDVPIVLSSFLYQRIHPDALANGWLTMDTVTMKLYNALDTLYLHDTIYDDNGQYVGVLDTAIYQNADSLATLAFPVQYTLFAFSSTPMIGLNPGSQVSFQVPVDLVLSNTTSVIESFQINLGDGSGWQTGYPGTTLYAQYAVAGEVLIRIKIPGELGGEDREARFALNIIEVGPPPHDLVEVSNLPTNNSCQISDNGYGTGDAVIAIRYQDENIEQLRKPIILVEGFDSNYGQKGLALLNKTSDCGLEMAPLAPVFPSPLDCIMDPDCNSYNTFQYGFGSITWNGIVTGKFYDSEGKRVFEWMEKFPQFLDSLTGEGYDIVFVDFKTNREKIQKNANALIKVIQWVNEQKTTDEELVVMGASMGGLIARYALAKMEADGCCHQTRMMVIADSPQKGANIPLSVQSFVREACANYNSKEAAYSYSYILGSEAAKQMVIYHLDGPQGVRDQFVQELDSMGFPQDVYKVAVVNGRGDGVGLLFGPGDELLVWEKSWAAPETVIGCVPTTGPMTMFQQIAYATPNSPNAPSWALMLRTKPLKNTMLNYADSWATYGVAAYVNCVKLPALASAAAAAFPLAAPAVYAGMAIEIAGVSAVFSGILSGIMTHNNNYLNSNQYYTIPTLPYDNAPGGLSNTMKTIADNSPSIITTMGIIPIKIGHVKTGPNADRHCFVPTVSGLALPESFGLFDPINTQYILDQRITPFDNVYIPRKEPLKNQDHVELTDDNISFIISELKKNDPLNLGQVNLNNFKIQGSTYNLGERYLQVINSVTVGAGGTFQLNGNLPLYFGVGTATPLPGSLFECHTNQVCGAYILVEDGGVFKVGDNNAANNRADMEVRKNGVLEIEAGGQLIVYQNSRLVIGEGAELILHPGATINLSGPNAVLELQGKVTLKPGASLRPTGTGILRLAQSAPDAVSFATLWDCQGSNALKVNGQGRRVEVVHKTYLPAGLDSVVFSGVETAIYPGVALHMMSSPVRFSFSRFTCTDTTDKHQGVFLYGQGVKGEHSLFKFGYYGLSDNLTLGTGALTLSGCRFTQNMIGLGTRDGQVDLFACRFFDNEASGWLAEDMQGNSRVEACEFLSHPVSGVTFSSQAGVLLEVSESEFKYNTNGLEVDVASVRATCSIFSFNTTAGIVSRAGSTLYLNEEATNVFNGNQHALALVNGGIPKLRNGKNNFSGSTWYATGTVPNCNCSWAMDVSQNVMPATSTPSGPSLPINLTYYQNSTPATVTPTNWTAMNALGLNTACENMTGMVSGNSLAASMFDELTTGRVVNTPLYPNWWLEEALADAAYKVSSTEQVFDDLNAIARFNEVLASLEAPFNELEQSAVTTAMDLMLMALGNAYEQELIPLNGGELESPESPYLALVTEQFNEQLGQLGLSGEDFFHANLALAQAYRMAEHFDYALAVLGSELEPFTIHELAATDYWTCVCQAESDLLQEHISPEDFAIQIEDCQTLLASAKMAFELVPGYTLIGSESMDGKLVSSFYPNPAIDRVHLDLVNHRGETNIHLIDSRGVIVRSERYQEAQPIDLDVSGLPAGVYLVRVKQTNLVEHVKLTILE